MSNMYPWINKKRNFIGGECPHKCCYCYVENMKRFPAVERRYSGKPRLIEKELMKNEGKGNTVFVQDCGDLFAEKIPSEWIYHVLNHLRDYPHNTYLFQSKNPRRFDEFLTPFNTLMPERFILGTTIESNKLPREYPMGGLPKKISKAPDVMQRAFWMRLYRDKGYTTMVSVEPILEFNIDFFTEMLRDIHPTFVSIGADSKGNCLPEPSYEKVMQLVDRIKGFTQVKMKSNLKRLKNG